MKAALTTRHKGSLTTGMPVKQLFFINCGVEVGERILATGPVTLKYRLSIRLKAFITWKALAVAFTPMSRLNRIENNIHCNDPIA